MYIYTRTHIYIYIHIRILPYSTFFLFIPLYINKICCIIMLIVTIFVVVSFLHAFFPPQYFPTSKHYLTKIHPTLRPSVYANWRSNKYSVTNSEHIFVLGVLRFVYAHCQGTRYQSIVPISLVQLKSYIKNYLGRLILPS